VFTLPFSHVFKQSLAMIAESKSNLTEDNDQERFTDEQIQEAESQIIEQSKKIDFYLTEFSLELLADKMNKGDFEVPNYQREYTWEPERKSRFIESLLIGLPIPFLFFWESPETGKLEIVDGSQRLRTIKEFFLGELALGELEVLSHVSGFRFKDFPESRQRKLKNRSIRGVVLNENADAAARFDFFERVNTGSKIANKAEVRRGALAGKFMDFVILLAEENLFIGLTPVTDTQKKEREREELVARFFAYSDGLEEYRDQVSMFIFKYCRKMNQYFDENPQEINIYHQRFMDTMEFVSKNFSLGFRRSAKGKISPRSRFEAIAIGSYLALKERPELANTQISVEEWLDSKQFKDATGADGANAKKRLTGRINFVRDRLLGV
jgi:Protein of unknown function DUF262